jgi:general secretion pathway protein C
MERFIRKHFWLLSGAFILIAAPVAAGTMHLLTRNIPALAPEPNAPAIVIERERITIPAQAQPAPARPSVTVDTSTAWGDIRTVGEHAYEISTADFQNALMRLDELSTQARVVPAFKDGKAQGFKMFAIRPHSLYAKLGLQNGDVLKRINGQSLQTPETALTAFQSLRESQHIELDLERGGSPVRKTYDVR